MSQPITETQNPLTLGMDVADPAGMVRLLRQSDAQLFAGYDTWASLGDEEMLESLARVGWRMSRHLTRQDAAILISGAGTSGRLAVLFCIEFNRMLRERRLPEVFKPLMAGGEAALIQAQEAAEDSAAAATRDIKEALRSNVKQGMYIGITCGLSAPYVGAQLDYIGGNANFDSVVVGFNPLSLARDNAIEGWDKTVKGVLDTASESSRFVLLNPVVGPEPITGSTRMKGGSGTKIVVEIAFACALYILDNEAMGEDDRELIDDENLLPLRKYILKLLRRYRDAVDAVYTEIPALAELVRLAGTALRSGGRIHYLGRGIPGVLGIIDASECPPTFGADLFDVRGYLREGWELFGYNSASMKARGKAYEVDLEYFGKSVIPEISKGDLVIGVAVGMPGEVTTRLLAEAAQAKASTAMLIVNTERPKSGDLLESLTHACVIEVPTLGFAPGINNEAELALKLCLNAITTGAHTMAGKIYGNIMIDLRISNSKLYNRAIGLVSRLTGAPRNVAHRALHYAIFKKQATDAELEKASVSVAVQRAVGRSKVVPMAILLATGKFTYEEAEERLGAEPRVRRLIEDAVSGKNETVS